MSKELYVLGGETINEAEHMALAEWCENNSHPVIAFIRKDDQWYACVADDGNDSGPFDAVLRIHADCMVPTTLDSMLESKGVVGVSQVKHGEGMITAMVMSVEGEVDEHPATG